MSAKEAKEYGIIDEILVKRTGEKSKKNDETT
jgi:ATP-dependent protease ClpP protease subunit